MQRPPAAILGFLALLVITAYAPPARGQDGETTAASAPAVNAAGGAASENSAGGAERQSASAQQAHDVVKPLLVLAVGVVTVLGLIIVLKVNAFLALITAAMVVSLLAPGELAVKISRVASAFGGSAGSIGIVIALAAVIGTCMLDSGAADRIVRAFLRLLGEKRSPLALMGSGFVLAVPVFFDTVFYLLVPLARSLHRRTAKQYLKYILAIAAGGAITHTLVPPTPGPLLVAANLGVDLGMMIIVGAIVALPAALAGLVFAGLADRIMKTPMRPIGGKPEPEPLKDSELPPLLLSLLPVILPVLLISTNTVLTTLADAQQAALLKVADISDWRAFRQELQEAAEADAASLGKRVMTSPGMPPQARRLIESRRPLSGGEKVQVVAALNEVLSDREFPQEEVLAAVPLNETAARLLAANRARLKQAEVQRMNRAILESAFPRHIAEHRWETPRRKAANISAVVGDANLALLISAVIALAMLVRQRSLSRTEMAQVVETSLMSGGVIILITAAGGAFGAMLQQAQVGDAIETLFGGALGAGDEGVVYLLLGFSIAMVLKVAQGSSTVAMIVGSGMMAAIVSPESLGFPPVYLATSIGAGSLVGSWMNDSGFWIFAKMGGLTETEALQSWSLMLVLLGLVSFVTSVAMAMLPLPFGL